MPKRLIIDIKNISFLAGAVVLLTGALSAAEAGTMVMTVDGQQHIGDVIAATVNTLTIKRVDTGYEIIPRNRIASVKVDIVNGGPIEGRFLDWSNGQIILDTGNREVTIRDGVITYEKSTSITPAVEPTRPIAPAAAPKPEAPAAEAIQPSPIPTPTDLAPANGAPADSATM